jgi:hypothetical protein
MLSVIAVRRCNGKWLVVELDGSVSTAAVYVSHAGLLWKVVHFLSSPPIVVPPTTENPPYPTPTNHSTGWTSRIITHIWTHCHNAWLDRNQALHGHNQQTKHLARLHLAQFRIRSLYDLRNQCSQFVCNCWFYPPIENHFSQVPDPTQLENWLALKEARILRHVASRRHTLHTSQQHITEYFTSTN